jgi:hypothetical protein
MLTWILAHLIGEPNSTVFPYTLEQCADEVLVAGYSLTRP